MEEKNQALTPIKAIRAKCLDCCCGSPVEVAECPCADCSLYAFRYGHNPNIKLTDEQKRARTAHLRKTPHVHGEEIAEQNEGM